MKRLERLFSLVLVLSLMVAPVMAQDNARDEGGDSSSSGTQPEKHESSEDLPRAARQLQRQLELDDDQASQIGGIVRESEKQVKALQEEQQAAIRNLLNDEQKAKFDHMMTRRQERGGHRNNRRNGGSGRTREGGGGRSSRGGGAGGMIGRMTGQMKERLVSELDLSEEQEDKLDTVFDELGGKFEGLFAEMRESGDFGAIREKLPELIKESTGKMKEFLNDEQKTKLDGLVEDMTAGGGMGGFGGRGRRGGGGGRNDPRGGQRGRTLDPAQRVKEAMETLSISDEDEAYVVKTFLIRIAELQQQFAQARRETRDELRRFMENEGLSDEAVEARVTEVRERVEEIDNRVEKAQAELSQIVTYSQEALLVIKGFLD